MSEDEDGVGSAEEVVSLKSLRETEAFLLPELEEVDVEVEGCGEAEVVRGRRELERWE